MTRPYDLFMLAAAFLLLSSTTAHAYLDSGTGSYILQILLGGVAALLFSVKVYWQRIKRFFVQRSRKVPEDDH